MRSKKIGDLILDSLNSNLGTERGQQMLENSLRRYGAGRSILVDRKGRIIAGNKTVEEAGAIGLEDVIVVESDGKKLVAVQRTDLDLERDKAARELAIADNRTSEVDLSWDIDILKALGNEADLGKFWTEKEIAALMDFGAAPESVQANLAELKEIRKAQRMHVIEGQDTENFLVVIFPSRKERQDMLKRLGMDENERYVAASEITITAGRRSVPMPNGLKVAPLKKSGTH